MSYPPPPQTSTSVRPPMMQFPPPLMMGTPSMFPANLFPGLEKPPVTTVFVGNISEKAPDNMIRSMLNRCGLVTNWKRVQGTNGKLQAFGFCEYDNPESTLRCIRLLNNYEISDKKLVVKVDQKTKELLLDYKRRKKLLSESTQSSTTQSTNSKQTQSRNRQQATINNSYSSSFNDSNLSNAELSLEFVDEDTLKEDRSIISSFEMILRTYHKELTATPQDTQQQPTPTTATTTAPPPPPPTTTTTVTAQQPTIETPTTPSDINSPIANFNTNENNTESKKQDSITQQKQTTRKRSRSRSRSRSNDSYNSKHTSHHHHHHHQSSYNRNNSTTTTTSSSSYNRNNKTSNSRSNYNEVSSSGTRRNSNDLELNEETQEQRRLEKKLREKELAYRERLRAWETRENKRAREYETEKEKESYRLKLFIKEGKKLKKFLEDYDDEKDDLNNYKGEWLAKRLKMREKEIESDNRDRLREKEELDELKRKLLENGNQIDDLENEAKKLQDEIKHKIMKKLNLNSSRSECSSSEASDDETDKKHRDNDQVTISKSNGNHEKTPKQEENEIKIDKQEEEEEKEEIVTFDNSLDKKLADFQSQITPKEEETSTNTLNTPNDALSIQYQQLGVDNMSEESMNMSSDGDDDDLLSPKQNIDSSMDLSLSPSSINSPSLGLNNLSNAATATTTTTTTVMIKKQISKNKSKTTIQPINQIFADDEDDDALNTQSAAKRAAKLQSLQQQQQQQQQTITITATNQSTTHLSIQNIEERKKAVKKLVESIPSDKDELFKFNLDWSQIDTQLMDKRIKPWINRKIIEYIGEEEASLNEFICSKIQDKQTPDKLLDDIKVILDDEAELFVKKLWRLLVYETESKRLGLSK